MLQSFESQIWKKSKTGKVCGELSHVQPSQKAKKQKASSLRKKGKLWNPDDPPLNITGAKYVACLCLSSSREPAGISMKPGRAPNLYLFVTEGHLGNHYLSNLSHLSWNSLCRNFAPFTIYHPKGRSDISIQKSTFYQGQCVTRPRPDQDFFRPNFPMYK